MAKIVLPLFLFAAAGAAAAVFLPDQLGTWPYVDRTPPQISIERRGGVVHFESSDAGAGLARLEVRVQQGDKSVPLPDELILADTGEAGGYLLDLKELPKEIGEGEAEIQATAIDSSVWQNSAAEKLSLTLDRRPPSVAILSQQHRMYSGGSEFLILEIRDQSATEGFVRVGENRYRAYPLKEAFPEKKLPDELFAVLFAARLGLVEREFNPTLTVVDAFGNTTERDIPIRYVEKGYVQSSPSLSERFLERKIPPLLEEAAELKVQQDVPSSPQGVSEWVNAFVFVNETFRGFLQRKITEVTAESSFSPFPTEPFVRPLAGTLTSKFGEQRFYTYSGQDAGSSFHDGQDLASVERDVVKAAGAGRVVFSGQLGIYGKTVIIDHGLGLTTLYGHLSGLETSEGDTVQPGQTLGRSGVTGLAGGDHLHYEVRVGETPVTPIEWWDPKWFADNIMLKLEGVLPKEAPARDQSAS